MNRSIRGRILLTLFLSLSILTAICATVVVAYVHEQRKATFDSEIQRRVGILSAMVQVNDAGPRSLGFELQPQLLPPGDLFAVRDLKGTLIARSPHWTNSAHELTNSSGANFAAHGRKYRGKLLQAIPVDDEDERDPSVQPLMVNIFYAMPTTAFDLASRKIDLIAASGSLFWIASSCAIAWFSITGGMSPLGGLAVQASAITEQSWSLQLSPEVQATSELRPVAQALEALVLRLGSALERERIFVSDAAHELKTSVSIAKSSLQVALQGPASQYGFGLERASEDVDRLSALVSRMLALASIEGSDRNKRTDVVSLDETILAACDQLLPMAALHGVELQMHLAGSGLLESEECLLQNLWVTIIENAIHYSPRGAPVALTSLCDGSFCTVSIQDQGQGIPPQYLSHIFERFYRVDSSRARDTGGFGLGLSIAKAIVDRHHGTIQITSNVGEGTTVVVVFPSVNPAGCGRALSQDSDSMA